MTFSTASLKDFIDQAASNAPTPGGGAIAALAGALGASMASMVANFTAGKKQYAEHEEKIAGILGKIGPLIEEFTAAVDADAIAFSGISEAYKLPRETDEQKAARKTAVDAALAASMRVPLGVVRQSRAAAELLPELAACGNKNLLSDAQVAAVMLSAAARCALVNVYANSSSLQTDEARAAEREGEDSVKRVDAVAAEVEAIIKQRMSAS